MTELAQDLRRGLEGRYRVEREIGRGGMAVVFLAQDLRHNRPVAIKVLRPELGDLLGAERFLREIAAVAGLTHPHILPLHDSGECLGHLFYVMPFLEGVSLRERLQRDGALPVAEALRITREIADALGYAHRQGLVHRDIKPENILFQAGHALLSDFGIARAVRAAGGERLTETGMAVGTIAYMSPEQAYGSADVDGRSDVYSLGCVLQEMLTGTAPFGDRPSRSGATAVPPSVAALVARMLSRDPGDRYATGDGLLAAIDDALRRASTPLPLGRHVPRWTILGAAGVVLVVAAVWALALLRAPSIRSLAVLPPQDVSSDSTRRYLVDGIHDALIGELAGIRALRVISRTSAARYRQSAKSVPDIARELGVDAVVEASVAQRGDRVTLRVHLIQARPTERDLGADTFERDLRAILALYKDAARAIAGRMRAPVAPDEAARLAASRPIDPEAYDAYLRGMSVLHDGTTAADYTRGLALLNAAIARDTAEPLPWAGVALAYDQIGHLSGQLPDAFARARSAAERAQRLGGVFPETDAALAQTRLYDDWDPRGADSLFQRAIQHNPSIPDALSHYGWSLLLSGRTDSAMASLRRAEEVDPLTGLWPAFTASAASWSRRPALAHAAIQRALTVNPDLPITQYVYGTILVLDGAFDAAIAAERRAAAGSRVWKFALGYVLARAGQHDEARRIAAELEPNPDGMTAWGLAEISAALGDTGRAVEWLETSAARRWNWIPWVDFNPAFASLRGDPRFEAFRTRVGAPRCTVCA